MKKTKIICTIGPASQTEEVLIQLIKSGMNVARLNFSHGNYDEKSETIKTIRKVSKELEIPVGIIADIQGPKLRLGELSKERKIEVDEEIILSSKPHENEIPLQFDLSDIVKKNHRIFLNDGLVELKVKSIEGKSIIAQAISSGVVSTHKGVNIPDSHFTKDIFTNKDKEDILFAIQHKLEYLALSFIQTPEDINEIKKFIKSHNSKIKICVKIEKKEAIDNLENIILNSDAVMIARGDLAIEAGAESVPVHQQRIIRLARELQRPVIVATQMLESMIQNPRPTRAEASDVGHAVMNQVDAVMLSGESAVGKNPIAAVKTMKNIINSVENAPEYKHFINVNWGSVNPATLQTNSIASAAEKLAYRLNSKLLTVATATGEMAIKIASFRPSSQIVAITHDVYRQNQLTLVWGIYPFVLNPTSDTDSFWEAIKNLLLKKDLGNKSDRVVMVGGTRVGVSGVTDTIKVVDL